MHRRKLKLGLAAASALAVTTTFGLQSAHADYAPSASDFVGVGSDTVQYASDFAADGDINGDAGYNKGKPNKVINFDATPDANARLAYGSLGLGKSVTTGGTTTLNCSPGTGSTAGTGNANANHVDSPCTLNPTIVLKAGTKPVQRPNGSGAGAAAILASSSIGYTRASSAQGGTLGAAYDSLTIGKDNLEILAAGAPSTTNAVPLSEAQLHAIYSCDDGTSAHAPVTWNEVGGSSTDAIIPLVPQVGSGTRKTFLGDIGVTTPGTCVTTVEENDPTAIANTTTPADAIEPMSQGRLNLFQGLNGSGASTGNGGYFLDPSCAVNVTTGNCTAAAKILTPDVAFLTGTPGAGLNVASGNLTTGLYVDPRSLFVYFRDSAVNAAAPAQSSGASGDNWVRSLFYDPCPDNPPVAGDGCTSDPIAGEVGKFGTPFYATTAGQADISNAGITPAYTITLGGP